MSGLSRPLPLKGHTDKVTALSWCQKRQILYSGSWDNSIRSWDLELPDKELLIFKGHEQSVYGVVVSEDGRHLYSGSFDSSVRIWDTDTAQTLNVIKLPRFHTHNRHAYKR